jgi:hypothetical protein
MHNRGAYKNYRDEIFTKIMSHMLKLDTNYGFHELFLNHLLYILYIRTSQ